MLLNLDSDAQKLNYRYKFILSLLLIISVICVYWPVKGYDFVSFDDFQYVVENPHVKSGISWDGYAWSVSV